MLFRPVMFIALVILLVPNTEATIRYVPTSYSSIQAAIHASVSGDTVVAEPGVYHENIIFGGKNILLTSRFYLSGDPSYVTRTIIDGSTPSFPDSGSCVRIVNGEDSSAVLQGFTITGGHGTLWEDEHGRPNRYWEGGGVIIALSSPTIRFNIIRDNNVNQPGGTSTGGGGVRLGDGSPRILNNIILNNVGQYGGGVVSNYASPVIRNNVIAYNRVSATIPGNQTFGGGGLWFNGDVAGNKIENNTIVFNSAIGSGGTGAGGKGGGMIAVFSATINTRNNVVWGNTQTTGPQIGTVSATAIVEYSDVEGGYVGTGNTNVNPLLSDTSFYLQLVSPCIDAGDTSRAFNDLQNQSIPGTALFPSRGMLRNDQGAYGGPGARVIATTLTSGVFPGSRIRTSETSKDFGLIEFGRTSDTINVTVLNIGASLLTISSISKSAASILLFDMPGLPVSLSTRDSITFKLAFRPSSNVEVFDTVRIVSSDSITPVQKIPLHGKGVVIGRTQGGIMYAASAVSLPAVGSLYSVNLSTGAATVMGSLGIDRLDGLAIRPSDGELYGVRTDATSSTIYRVSRFTGDALAFRSIPVPYLRAITFGGGDTLFGATVTGILFRINIDNGDTVRIGTSSLAYSGLSMSPTSHLMWASVRPAVVGRDNIYTVDRTSGSTLLVGPTGLGGITPYLAFDPRGRLYAIKGSGTTTNTLITIDTATAVGTTVGSMGVAGIAAIVMRTDTALTAVQEIRASGKPGAYHLADSYPNPFNPTTTITFQIPTGSVVSLKVFDLLGREVATLVEGTMQPGSYTSRWNASGFGSGVYICKLTAGEYSEAKKLILMK